MARQDARERLLALLERKAFDPVLRADPNRFPAAKRDKLRDVQRRTETEVDRFRHYGSARDVVVNFKRDLHSEPAEKVHRELRDLGLPTIEDVREEFERLAAELGVE
jgi:hypothetical protein